MMPKPTEMADEATGRLSKPLGTTAGRFGSERKTFGNDVPRLGNALERWFAATKGLEMKNKPLEMTPKPFQLTPKTTEIPSLLEEDANQARERSEDGTDPNWLTEDTIYASCARHSLASRVSHPFCRALTNAASLWQAKESPGWRGQHWMWEARVWKRLVDRSNASALSGAELKKLVQEFYFAA